MFLIGGIIIGLVLYRLFLVPEIKERVEIVERIKTDTLFVTVIDTVTITRTQIKHEYLRDTVLVDYKPAINLFKADFPALYGNIRFRGEVLGEILKSTVETDFRIPRVTTVIEKEKTRTVTEKPSGLYLGGGISNLGNVSVGATYLMNKTLIGYDYNPQLSQHSIRAGVKVF